MVGKLQFNAANLPFGKVKNNKIWLNICLRNQMK